MDSDRYLTGNLLAAKPKSRMVSRALAWPALPGGPMAQALALQFQLDDSQWWSPQRLLAYQLREVHKLVRHAQATTKFYRERLADTARVPLKAFDLAALSQIPLLTRGDIQLSGPDMISAVLPAEEKPTFVSRTSGSTSEPVVVHGTARTRLMARAISYRIHRWAGRDAQGTLLNVRTLRGRPADQRRAWSPSAYSGPSLIANIMQPIAGLLDDVLRIDPDYLQSHPYTMMGLMEEANKRGVRPARLSQCICFGEPVDESMRAFARDSWQIELIDNYSAVEVGTIANQCPEGPGLHIQAENVLLEVIDDAGAACEPGEIGRVVVTSLQNYATPLIRYVIGDYAIPGEPCACGRGLPLLDKVVGRFRNLLVTPSGEKYFPDLIIEITELAPIAQFQVRQPEAHRLELYIKPSETVSADQEAAIGDYFERRFGYPFELTFHYVDDIQRDAGGKYEQFKSDVAI